jgi:hypothetical protein
MVHVPNWASQNPEKSQNIFGLWDHLDSEIGIVGIWVHHYNMSHMAHWPEFWNYWSKYNLQRPDQSFSIWSISPNSTECDQ